MRPTNPYRPRGKGVHYSEYYQHLAFEAGVDALKASGRCIRRYGSKANPRLHIPGLHGVVSIPGGNPGGWLVFIEG